MLLCMCCSTSLCLLWMIWADHYWAELTAILVTRVQPQPNITTKVLVQWSSIVGGHVYHKMPSISPHWLYAPSLISVNKQHGIRFMPPSARRVPHVRRCLCACVITFDPRPCILQSVHTCSTVWGLKMASQQAVSVHTCIREHMQGSLGLLPAIHPPHNVCRFAVQIGRGYWWHFMVSHWHWWINEHTNIFSEKIISLNSHSNIHKICIIYIYPYLYSPASVYIG